MPFMKGAAPIRRTLKYLDNFHIKLKDRVEVVAIHYNSRQHKETCPQHAGAEQFVFWNLPQLQYKNPEVQMLTFKNMTPSPFIRIFCKNEEEILIDIDGKSNDEIVSHMHKIIGKKVQDSEPASRLLYQIDERNPSHFGWGCKRQCMCEMFGQVPCSGMVPIPKVMRGKYKYNPELIDEEIEEWEAEDEAERQALEGGGEDD